MFVPKGPPSDTSGTFIGRVFFFGGGGVSERDLYYNLFNELLLWIVLTHIEDICVWALYTNIFPLTFKIKRVLSKTILLLLCKLLLI